MIATKIKKPVLVKNRKTNEKKSELIFAETHTVAPAPSRDYHALHLYQKKFVWTQWKISHGPSAKPLLRIVSMEEFLRDVPMQNELTYIFGPDTTNLINDLAHENWSFTSLPSNVIQKILSYIDVQDILRLSQVCKRLTKECSKDELWKNICKKQWKILLHTDIEKAGLIGWKNLYLEKMRPKRYKPGTIHHPKLTILQRSHVSPSIKTTESKTSSLRTSVAPPKRIQGFKKPEPLRATSEILGRDFKVVSTATTGKSIEKPFKGRSDFRTTSSVQIMMTPRSNFDRKYYHQPSRSTHNLISLPENSLQNDIRKSRPHVSKCSVVSIRPQSGILTETQSAKLKGKISRPSTGMSLKAKH